MARSISVALYGAGSYGEYVFRRLADERPDITVKAFFDDSKRGELYDLPIMHPDGSSSMEIDLVLVTSSYWREISRKLVQSDLAFCVMDLFSAPAPESLVVKKFGDSEIKFDTPNRFLWEASCSFEKIEPGTIAWINEIKPNSVFYDIGASCGVYSLYASIAKGCQVFAFEPDAQNFAVLEKNHYLNRGEMKNRFVALNLGLSDGPNLLPLIVQDFLAGSHGKVFESSNRIVQREMESEHIQHTLLESIDNLITRFEFPCPNYIKIDVDGCEKLIVDGACRAFRDESLTSVLIETDELSAREITKMMFQNGFSLNSSHEIREVTGSLVSGVKNYQFDRTF